MTTPISQLAVPWADCQGESVMDQMRHGVRYLDLRAVWVEGGAERIELGLEEGEADWLVTHTLLGGPIEDVFIQACGPGALLRRRAICGPESHSSPRWRSSCASTSGRWCCWTCST